MRDLKISMPANLILLLGLPTCQIRLFNIRFPKINLSFVFNMSSLSLEIKLLRTS